LLLDKFSVLKIPDLLKSLCQELVGLILPLLKIIDLLGHLITLLCELQLPLFLFLEFGVQSLLQSSVSPLLLMFGILQLFVQLFIGLQLAVKLLLEVPFLLMAILSDLLEVINLDGLLGEPSL